MAAMLPSGQTAGAPHYGSAATIEPDLIDPDDGTRKHTSDTPYMYTFPYTD